MNLDELRTVQSKERSKDSLQHLRESFYADVADYVADLKDQRERAAERADSPFDDPEVNRLTDEINTAEDVVEAVYERRVGKIVKRASLAAAGMPADEEGLTSEEQELFTELVERIEANKEQVLDVLAGNADGTPASDAAPAPGDPPTPGSTSSSGASPSGASPSGTSSDRADAPSDTAGEDVSAADVMGGGGAGSAADPEAGTASGRGSADPTRSAGETAAGTESRPASAEAVAERPDGERTASATAPDDSPTGSDGSPTAPDESASDADADSDDPLAGLDERTTVRVTDDVGEIFGVDERTYDLASEDVVTLPEANAAPLVERGAAERLE